MQKRKYLLILTIAFLSVYIIRTSIINIDWVASGSMLPRFDVNSRIVSNQLAYGLNFPASNELWLQWLTPKRGEIILFRNPNDQYHVWMKRVIGLPNDIIEFKDHHLYINHVLCSPKDRYHEKLLRRDKSFSEDFRIWSSYLEKDWGPITVGEGELFLMGDNRGSSLDSRTWGTIPQKYLIGKVLAQVWPLPNFR